MNKKASAHPSILMRTRTDVHFSDATGPDARRSFIARIETAPASEVVADARMRRMAAQALTVPALRSRIRTESAFSSKGRTWERSRERADAEEVGLAVRYLQAMLKPYTDTSREEPRWITQTQD